MRKIVLMIFAVMLTSLGAYAQNRQITGTVTSEDGHPLPGVTVVVTGTQTGTTTGADGRYSISAPQSSSLTFRSLGMTEQIIDIGNRSVVDITMISSSEAIDDIVVVGYGAARKVGTVVGSVARVDSEKFQSRPSMNVMDALQGQVAGLDIMTSSGEPSATSSIRLHGIGSVATEGNKEKNEPLVILDGSPITLGTLLMMNQNDFESVNILKDASATSIYGSRAANGVIYVVSKRGRRDSGESAVVTLRTQYSMSNVVKPKLKAMTTKQYVDYMEEIELIDEDYGSYLRSLGETDWFKEIYESNAPMIQTDLSVSGGSAKTSYYLSGSYNDTKGVAPGSKMERYTFRSNIESVPREWLKTGMSLSTGYASYENAETTQPTDDGVGISNPAIGALVIPHYQRAYDENGQMITILEDYTGHANPLIMPKYFANRFNRLQVNGNIYLEVNPVKNLSIRSNLAANAFDYREKRNNSPDYRWNAGVGSVTEYTQRDYTWTSTNTVEYSFDVNTDHNFIVLAGQEGIYNGHDRTGIRMNGITDSRFMYLNHGTVLAGGFPVYRNRESTFNSFFGRFDYNFRETYFLDFSIRDDASSRFSKNHRHATFYAVGAMWNLKKENFLSSSEGISQLSLRASYGTSGNSVIGDYSQYATLEKIQYMGNAGWAPNVAGNEELKWEKQSKFTVGVNTEFFNRVRVSVEYYNRNTKDMLIDVPIPRTTGFDIMSANVGHMRNAGVDLTINADLFRNRDWFINFNATFNYNKNQMIELFNGLEEYPFQEDSYMIKGQPFGVFKMFEWRGVDSQTGLPQWTAADGGITNNAEDAVLVNTKKSPFAPYIGGAGFTVAWKNLSLSADMTWMAGRWMYNNNLFFTENLAFAGLLNQTTGVRDYWKQPGDKARYPSLDYQYDNDGRGSMFDTSMLENASFIRLKNIQLAYDLPMSVVSKTKVFQGMRVWVSGRNLLTWTNYRGQDPEYDGLYNIDNYPNTRQVTFGIELKF